MDRGDSRPADGQPAVRVAAVPAAGAAEWRLAGVERGGIAVFARTIVQGGRDCVSCARVLPGVAAATPGARTARAKHALGRPRLRALRRRRADLRDYALVRAETHANAGADRAGIEGCAPQRAGSPGVLHSTVCLSSF